MGLIPLYTKSTVHSSSNLTMNATFCNCKHDDRQYRYHSSSKSYVPIEVCHCGENECQQFDWTWDKERKQPQTIFYDEMISFHPCYSQGTSVVRGECELPKGFIHYWEVKIIDWLSGTDLVSD